MEVSLFRDGGEGLNMLMAGYPEYRRIRGQKILTFPDNIGDVALIVPGRRPLKDSSESK